jgi:D-inositol-3-phosphate glycosyltransferase
MIMFHTLGAIKNAVGIGENEPALRIEAEGRLARNCERIVASTEKESTLLQKYYGIPVGRSVLFPAV